MEEMKEATICHLFYNISDPGSSISANGLLLLVGFIMLPEEVIARRLVQGEWVATDSEAEEGHHDPSNRFERKVQHTSGVCTRSQADRLRCCLPPTILVPDLLEWRRVDSDLPP